MPDDKIPALDRGLKVIDFLASQTEGTARYAQIKLQFPGITDASLNRLLKALVASHAVDKLVEGGYRLNDRVLAWGNSGSKTHWLDRAKQQVSWLVEHHQESAACVILKDGSLNIVCSQAQVEGVHIMVPGSTLHFEADHAAALATMSQLDEATWRQCATSSLSRNTETEFSDAFKSCRLTDGVYKDKSLARPGICRLGIPTTFEEEGEHIVGAYFFCLTEVQCEAKLEKLRKGLLHVVKAG